MRTRISATIAVVFFALFSPLQIPSAHAAVAAGVGVVQNNLLMDFDLANPSGISGTTLTDLSGNGYNGTIIQSSGQPSLNTGQGNYLNFAGSGTTGGYVDIPDIVSPTNWTGLSVSFYANLGTSSVVERIFDFGIGAVNNNIWVGVGNGTNMAIEVWHDASSPGWCQSAVNSLVNNEWAQWTVVLDGTNCVWYKNNFQSSTTAYSYLPWAKTLTTNFIGDSNWTSDPSLEGGIGELAIYKSALSASERTQNYNAQTDITALTMSGSSNSVNENQSSATSFGSNKANTTFSIIGGADSDKFDLAANGTLTFKSSYIPNYEAPVDNGGDRIYNVTVRGLDANGNFGDLAVTITINNVVEGTSLSTPTLSATPYKGIAITITVTPTGDGTSIPGKVSYLIGGKRIPTCYKKAYSGTGNSTCTFDPSLRGNQEISVTFTPTNTNFTGSASKKSFLIYKRSTVR